MPKLKTWADLPKLAGMVFGVPLAVTAERAKEIIKVVDAGVEARGLFDDEEDVRRNREEMIDSSTGIMTLQLHSTLAKRTLGMRSFSGLTAYEEIAGDLEFAARDSRVRGVLMDMDSPGGSVHGLFELAAAMRQFPKPLWAQVNDMAASAAYLIAAQADRIVTTQTGVAGSMGVLLVLRDTVRRDEKVGLTYHIFSAGDGKKNSTEHAPLDKEMSVRLQAEVDRVYGIYAQNVSAGRPQLNPQDVRDLGAYLYFGGGSVDAGLTDGVATLEETTDQFRKELETMSEKVTNAGAVAAANPQDRSSAEEATIPVPMSALRFSFAEQTVPATANAEADAAAPLPPFSAAMAQEIADLCAIADRPDLIAGFIREKTPVSVVREKLIEQKVKASLEGSIDGGHVAEDPKRGGGGVQRACQEIANRTKAEARSGGGI